MNRRDWIKTAGAAGLASMLPAEVIGMQSKPSQDKCDVQSGLKRLMLRHTWTTTMSSSAYRDTVQVQYRRDGITGYGEGAPIIRYKEFPEEARKAIEAIASQIVAGDPLMYQKYLAQLRGLLGSHQHAAMAAVDIAIFDWLGKKMGVPLYQFLGLDPADAPITDFSIGIDTPEITRQKTREAADFPVLKVKVGLQSDEETIEAVRSVTKKPIRVDANEGWIDKEEAIRKINWLETQGIEYVEQPMPAHMIEETKYVRSKVHLPIFADEACTDINMIPHLTEAFDGINVKLDKAGGILESLRWIQVARAMNLKVMLGCMVSSSCSITAAAHLSPLVDHADLDGNLLVANDPWVGVRVEKGKLLLPSGPGLGLTTSHG
ncbi:dipeptide epimerase [Acidicapsa acidisoli]|uniref:dipeptide epimerase n=1 Tax=Acidicapsa acidisoli TaxID=1615681 RepID=UPI0021E03BD7|nr:dipeptide epimerase [Acidicapsa acidisoli]